MKRVITTPKQRAARLLERFPKETVNFVREYKDEIENLFVYHFNGHDWVQEDGEDEIDSIESRYVHDGQDEGLIDGYEDLEMIYEALCILDED